MQPLVGIIMGSSSDWETMRHAAATGAARTAASSVTLPGTWWRLRSGKQTYSANAPRPCPNTASPGSNEVTSDPTETTVPKPALKPKP